MNLAELRARVEDMKAALPLHYAAGDCAEVDADLYAHDGTLVGQLWDSLIVEDEVLGETLAAYLCAAANALPALLDENHRLAAEAAALRDVLRQARNLIESLGQTMNWAQDGPGCTLARQCTAALSSPSPAVVELYEMALALAAKVSRVMMLARDHDAGRPFDLGEYNLRRLESERLCDLYNAAAAKCKGESRE